VLKPTVLPLRITTRGHETPGVTRTQAAYRPRWEFQCDSGHTEIPADGHVGWLCWDSATRRAKSSAISSADRTDGQLSLPSRLPPRQAQHRHRTGHDQENHLQAHRPKIIPSPDGPRPARSALKRGTEPAAICKASPQVAQVFGIHRHRDRQVTSSFGITGRLFFILNGAWSLSALRGARRDRSGQWV
jgi:hypothetical protein